MKKILYPLSVAILFGAVTTVYINFVMLPTKVHSLIVNTLEEHTGKKVILGSVTLNPLKGLVLKDLIVYEDKTAILNAREITLPILIQPIFNKTVVITSARINSPTLFVERRPDNTINIIDAFFSKPISGPKDGFTVLIYGIGIKNASIVFQDNAVDPTFSKEIIGLDVELALRLPEAIRFDAKFKIPAGIPMKIEASGEYDLLRKEWIAQVDARDLALDDFYIYYSSSGLSFPEGYIDALVGLNCAGGIIEASVTAETDGLVVKKGAVTAKLDSDIRGHAEYALSSKDFSYSAMFDSRGSNIDGIPFIRKADNIKGVIEFSDSSISSGMLEADIIGQPVSGKVSIEDLKAPVLDISISSDLELDAFKITLKEEFGFSVPVNMKGPGKLRLSASQDIRNGQLLELGGSLEMAEATLSPSGGKPVLDGVSGTFNFSEKQLRWSDVRFNIRGTDYSSSGELTNFSSPGVQIDVESKNLSFGSIFAVSDKIITIARLKGKYLGSKFDLAGKVKLEEYPEKIVDINGSAIIDLADLKEMFKGPGKFFSDSKLSGKARCDFTVTGDPSDLKSVSADIKIDSSTMQIYGVKPKSVVAEYRQHDGIGELKRLHSYLYAGTVEANAKFQLLSPGIPYFMNADIRGIRLERLKEDTQFKDEDISGAINSRMTLNGNINDVSRLSGTAKLNIVDGRLWQLNLFKGLGVLIFTSDFSNIVFRDGYCDLIVKEKTLYTDNLRLTSDLITMEGMVKIGFDGALTAALKTELKEAAMDGSSRKDLAQTIQKYSTIEGKGTLKDPKFRIKPNVVDFIKDRFFSEE